MNAGADPRVAGALAARERLSCALESGDADALADLLAGNLVVNAPINRIVDRNDLLDRIRRGERHHADGSMTRRIEYAEARDGVVVIMGEEAILTTRDASTSSTVRRRFTDIWQWNDGSWQLAVCQITVLSPEAV